MENHDREWFKQRAREKREREAGRRSYQINCQRRDLKELEALKNQLLKEAKKK